MARQDRDSQYGGGAYSSSSNQSGRGQSYGGGNTGNSNSSILSKVVNFIASGGLFGAIFRGITSSVKKKNKKDSSGNVYSGEAFGYNEADEKKDYKPNSFLSGGPKGGGLKKNIGGKIVSVSPTAAEVSQSQAANATSEEDSIYLRKKKTKAKGRSATILTSSKGVDENLTLGKKSLLGL